MAFGDNSVLISTAETQNLELNDVTDVLDGFDRATIFVISGDNVGDDLLFNFGSDDSLTLSRKIFDGNNDGFISFGTNGVLDINRTGRGDSRAGNDQLQFVGENGANITEIRYLGEKFGSHVYANSDTIRNLFDTFGQSNVVEGSVGDDEINLASGARVVLHDNALGLNLGGDTVTGFGADDLLVSTTLIGENTVVNGNLPDSDPVSSPEGQIEFAGLDGVSYLGTNTIDGIDYFYYGTADTTVNPFAAD